MLTLSTTEAALTRREVEIINLMARGLNNKELAGKLFIAENTVRNHRKAIMQKTGCHNIAELAIYCLKKGIITLY